MKKLLSLLTISTLIVSSAGCTQAEDSASEIDENIIYNIGICRDDDSPYASLVVQGYKDALIDNFGEDSLVFIEQTASTSPSAPTAIETILQTGVDDIFTYGDNSLSSATELTNSTPIIFAGVYNYEDVLHIVSSEDNPTLNVTGISSMPNIDEQVSLLIEACDHNPVSVGILYDPTDNLSIIQNEEFENYLDDAGIPWKEYEITDSVPVDAEPDTNGDTIISANNVTLPSLSSAASGKEGANIDIDPIGNYGDLTGINEPMSARTPKISKYWPQPTPADETTAEDQQTDETGETDAIDVSEGVEGEDTIGAEGSSIETAFNECGAIYLCQDNSLCESEDFLSSVRQLAAETNTVTLGGDEIIGENTLVSLYEDPYDIGYRCGKKSIDILTGEKTADELSIDSPAGSKTTKLFDSGISDTLGKTWPKSFHEHDEYLTSYDPGSLTERIEIE